MIQDVKTIYNLVKPVKGLSHLQRMEEFYKRQSGDYDRFRKKLLSGRSHLYQQLCEIQPKGIWIDLGAGTGASLDFLSDEQIASYEKIYLVDISPSLLAKAQEKIISRQLTNVETVECDILDFHPPEFCDVASFSYSLSMTPQWYKVLDHTYQLLAPEGTLGVVDFYVAEKHPLPGLQRHDPATRHFWPLWFSYDNVFLSADHLPYLINKFEKIQLFEGFTPLPMLPIGKVPYFSFIGKKA